MDGYAITLVQCHRTQRAFRQSVAFEISCAGVTTLNSGQSLRWLSGSTLTLIPLAAGLVCRSKEDWISTKLARFLGFCPLLRQCLLLLPRMCGGDVEKRDVMGSISAYLKSA